MGSRWRIALWAVGLVLTAALLSGCGSSSSSSNADPAMLAPASTPLYAGVAIKPPGGSHGPAASNLQRLTHLSDPYASLAEALLQANGSQPRYKSRIATWVGARAGVFLTSLSALSARGSPPAFGSLGAGASGALGARAFGSLGARAFSSLGARAFSSLGAGAFGASGAQGAIVLGVSDLSQARAFLAERARSGYARPANYRGVRFQLTGSGLAEGIVADFVVIGSQSGMRAAIDSSRGATPLSRVGGYLPPASGAIANAYLAPQRLAALGRAQGGAQSGRAPSAPAASPTPTAPPTPATQPALETLGGLLDGVQKVAFVVTPSASSLSLQGRLSATAGTTPLFGQAGAQMLASLPSGSWLALGTGDLGSTLPHWLALLHGLSASGGSRALSALGAGGLIDLLGKLGSSEQLRAGFARWAGPAGLYASGSGLLELEAALVIDSRDPAASRAAVAQIASVARSAKAIVADASIPGTQASVSVKLAGFPAVIYVAAGQGKLVVGLGQASVVGALNPTTTLASSPSYATASSTLGEGIQPSAIVEFPMLLSLLEAIGVTQSPGFSNAVPYLKSLGTLTAGSASQTDAAGQTIRFRAVLGLAGTAASG